EARRERLVVSLFRVSPSEIGGSRIGAGEGQTSGPVASPRVRPRRIEEGEEIVFLVRRRDGIPAKGVIETELRSHPPGVARVSDPGVLYGDRPRPVTDAEARKIHLFEQKARDRTSAGDVRYAGGSSVEPELAGLAGHVRNVVHHMPVFDAEFQCVLCFD